MEDIAYIKERNRVVGENLVNALKKRHFEAVFCEDKDDVIEQIKKIITKDETIAFGGSVTLYDTGIISFLENNGYNLINRDKSVSSEEKLELTRKGLLADTFLMSTNSISEDGQLVNIDGTGNRVAALCYGPKQVIVVAGMNKVVKTVEDAYKRARIFAAPVNARRIAAMYNRKTPCLYSGTCEDCKSPDSICAQIVTTRLSKPAGKIKVILVNEDYGY